MGFFLCKPPKCPEIILLEYNEMWEIKKSQLDVSGGNSSSTARV